MPRHVREANLSTREARKRLAVRQKPYFRSLDEGLHAGYRRSHAGSAWVIRWYQGDGKYGTANLSGRPDDVLDADGVTVLNWTQAQRTAREQFQLKQRGAVGLDAAGGPLLVKGAIVDYVEYLKAEKKTGEETEKRLAKHVGKALQGKAITALIQADIETWKRGMVRRDENEPDVERRSKDSANRVLTMLKAALNRAFNDDANDIASDVAWRRVKPFREVGRSRDVHLDGAQCRALLKSSELDLRNLATAALLTGARPPHELAGCRVKHFRADTGTLSVDGKTGPRDIVLTGEAVTFFTSVAAGKEPNDLLLPKADGTTWGKNHHTRPMADAVAVAKLPPGVTIYALRHTHASQSILAGMNLKLLAENMGTSIRMLEQHYGKFIAASRRRLVEESSFKLGLDSVRAASAGAVASTESNVGLKDAG
jgi:integrase